MRHGKFCPKCGKSTEKLYDNLCSECFLKKLSPSDKIPEKIVVGTCKVCGNIYIRESKFPDLETAVENFLEKLLRQREIKSATYRIDGDSIFLTVELEIDDLRKEIEQRIPVVNKAITCRFCNLKKASYYNVTMQIRVPKIIEEKILREIEDEVSRLNKFDNYSFISRKQKLREGTDIYMGSKSAAEHVVKYLQQKYKIKTKISRKLYGLVEGKKSYRDTILVSISD